MMTREDRAREAEEYHRAVTIEGWAEEYHRAVTIEGWEYYSRSVKVLKEENALAEIDAMVNGFAREGWRLHTIQFGINTPYVYVVFERRRDYDIREEVR